MSVLVIFVFKLDIRILYTLMRGVFCTCIHTRQRVRKLGVLVPGSRN